MASGPYAASATLADVPISLSVFTVRIPDTWPRSALSVDTSARPSCSSVVSFAGALARGRMATTFAESTGALRNKYHPAASAITTTATTMAPMRLRGIPAPSVDRALSAAMNSPAVAYRSAGVRAKA